MGGWEGPENQFQEGQEEYEDKENVQGTGLNPIVTPATLSPKSGRAEMGWGLTRVREEVFWTLISTSKEEWVKAGGLGREAGKERRNRRQRDKEGEGEREE